MAYLFLSSGVNNFTTLPTITKNTNNLSPWWKTLDNESLSLNDKVSILGFINTLTTDEFSSVTNVCHEVYLKNKRFPELQVVYLVPEGNQEKIKNYIKTLSRDADLSSFHFVFASKEEIQSFYESLKLDKTFLIGASNFVYIIDKKRTLRARKYDEGHVKQGYLASSPADLHNNMEDDIKVLLAEYRLALKRNYKIVTSDKNNL